jgi:hypothetical protein
MYFTVKSTAVITGYRTCTQKFFDWQPFALLTKEKNAYPFKKSHTSARDFTIGVLGYLEHKKERPVLLFGLWIYLQRRLS